MLKRALFVSCLFLGVLLIAYKACALNTRVQKEQSHSLNYTFQNKFDIDKFQSDLEQVISEIEQDTLDFRHSLNENSKNTQEVIKQLTRQFNNKLKLQKNRLDDIKSDVKDNEKSISIHYSVVTALAGIVIGFVGIFAVYIAVVAYVKQKDIEKKLDKRAEEELKKWELRLEKVFEEWQLEQMDIYEKECELLRIYMYLKSLFEPEQPKESEGLLSKVKCIANSEREFYRPLLKRINEAEWANDQVKNAAKEGLEILDQQRGTQDS